MKALFCIFLAIPFGASAQADGILLERLDLTRIKSLAPPMGFPATAARSVTGAPLTMKGVVYPHGVGTHSGSRMAIDLGGEAEKFVATVGVDDTPTALPNPLPGSAVPQGLQRHPGTATVEIWLDGKPVFDTGALRRGGEPKAVSVDLSGAKKMTLIMTDAGRWPYNNPIDLAGATIVMKPGARSKPKTLAIPDPPRLPSRPPTCQSPPSTGRASLGHRRAGRSCSRSRPPAEGCATPPPVSRPVWKSTRTPVSSLAS